MSVWRKMFVIDDEERHTVVFSGFPAKSRKKLLIDQVKLQLPVVERLAGHSDVLDRQYGGDLCSELVTKREH